MGTARLIPGSVPSLPGMHVGALLSAERAVRSVWRLRISGVCEPDAARFSSSAEEPMLSRHRSMPCQCDTCTAGCSDLHIGEVDEYGDNVQRHDTDRGKGTTRGER